MGDRDAVLLLIKNPAGANEVIRTLAADGRPKQLLLALNDRIADGRDVSWIWDVDFELLAGNVQQVVTAGTRAAELAMRFAYGGVEPDRLIVARGITAALDQALAGGEGLVYLLAPTPRCSSCARCSRGAGSCAVLGGGMTICASATSTPST